MRFFTHNAGGLKRGGQNAQAKGDWLLSHITGCPDFAALAIQETHCEGLGDFCQAVCDMAGLFTVVMSPPLPGDPYAGVALVISREYKVEQERVVLGGRVLAVRVASVVDGGVLDLVVVYGYPHGRQEWLGEMEGAVDDAVPAVVLGDFNFVTDVRDRDRGAMNEYDVRQARKMGEIEGGLDLVDTYRLTNPEDRVYSFVATGGSRSRIDRCYVSGVLAGRVKMCRYLRVLAKERGHRLGEVELSGGIEPGRGYWKFNVSLLKDRTYVELVRGIIRQARETREGENWDDLGEWWDFLKFLLRTRTVEYCKQKERTRREYVEALELEREMLLEDVRYGIGGEEARRDLERTTYLIEQEEERRAEGCRVRARVPNFEGKEPGIAYISKIEKSRTGRNLIYALRDS